MKQQIKQEIYNAALQAKKRNEESIAKLSDQVSLEAYRHLVRKGSCGDIWTEAFQTALQEHEIIVIPASQEVYWLDTTIVIPSNRRIEANGAIIRMVAECEVIMLRNEHTHDGTFEPILGADCDENISIHGGSWEECSTDRGIRKYAEGAEGFHGVQTLMLFNNLKHLTISDVTFARAKSFSVQVGDLTDGVFENFFFIGCFADGLHVNGNSKNLWIRNFSGHVGDDLVALNMYDWLGSSINYGPACNIFCEEIHSAPDSKAKAMRLQPGKFEFRNGQIVDCRLENVYIRKVSGIFEYKLYWQTPPYRLGEKPEGAGVGSANNIFYEDIHVISNREWYPVDDPITGYFGMFFLNSNIGYISLENIEYVRRPDESPRSFLVAVGPMSCRMDDIEVFDPYASSVVNTLELENIRIDGKAATKIDEILHEISFDDVNQDGFSSGKGTVKQIILNGKRIRG